MRPVVLSILMASLLAAFPQGLRAESSRPLSDLADIDLDRTQLREGPATRVRWLFRPSPGFARAQLSSDGGAVEVARLVRFSDLRILEAPAESLAAVEAAWSGHGQLQLDISGTALLDESTVLVGSGSGLWDTLGLRGDGASSVALLDSGVDTAHDDLGDPDFDDQDTPPMAGDADDWSAGTVDGLDKDFAIRVVGWRDVADDLPQAVGPYDYHYHGTAVASAAFGGGKIDSRLKGVAPEGRFVVVKIWNFENRWERWASDFLLGADWVLAKRDLYNIRACLVTTSWPADLGIGAAVDSLLNAGIAVIAAAGNSPAEAMGYPARLADVITVGATNSQGRLASYSTPADPGSAWLDLVAPGGSLVDPTDMVRVADNEPNDAYRGRVGTSIAAAHVAGAVSILQQSIRESGHSWRYDRDQVRWLASVLRITAAEVDGAESGAAGTPRTNRFGPDDWEGWGLLQIPAAVGAVREVLWVGEDRRFQLTAAVDGPASWAARLPVQGVDPLSLDLIPPPGADFDLLLYFEEADGHRVVARSDHPGLGRAESVRLDHPRSGWYVVVVKRVLGAGEARLLTGSDSPLNPMWPLELLSVQTSAPTRYDLDQDGREELILTNELFASPSDHRIYVVDSEGRSRTGFPRFLAGNPQRIGHLETPAVGRFGSEVSILAAGETGELYAVTASGGFRFRSEVTRSSPTTAPMIIDEGTVAHAVLGAPAGLILVDTAGAAEDTLEWGAGFRREAAAADLDGDGADEIVAVDDAYVLHVVESTGQAWPGWPQPLSNTVEITAPVLMGLSDGAPPPFIAVGRIDLLGGCWLHLWTLDGNPVSGFPLRLNSAESTALDLSPLSVAPILRGGELNFVLSFAQMSQAEEVSLEFRAVGADGSLNVSASMSIARREFTNTFFDVATIDLSEALVVEWTSSGTFEFVQHAQLAWVELVRAPAPRFGSTDRWILWPTAPGLAAASWDLDEGHRLGLVDRATAPLVADLDADGRTELYLPRGDGIAKFRSRLPGDLGGLWSRERGGAARRACGGCEAQIVVANPPERRVEARLRVWPNPFNPRTLLELEVPGSGSIEWELFDLLGRRLRHWIVQHAGPEPYRQEFEAVDDRGHELASGSYFLRASFGRQALVRRLVLIR